MLWRAPSTEFKSPIDPRLKISYPTPASRQDEVRTWLKVVAILSGAWLVLAWPWLSGAVTIPWDAKAHFHAQVVFLAQSIHRGESPFWAPFVFAGHPQIADPQSLITSLPHLLLAAVTANPTFQMVDGVTLGMLLFGAIGVLGFARDRHWHPAAALVAALAFAWGGSASWRVQHVGQILSIVYFPWAFWMLERGLRLSSARYGALSGLFAALILLDPDQVAFLGLVTLAGCTIAYILAGPGIPGRLKASLRPILAGAAVGLVITILPTLMVLNFADNSNRAHFTISDAEMGSLHPSSLLTFLIANLFGTIGTAENFWGAPSQHWPYIVNSVIARNMANFYMGILPLAGIGLWLASRPAYSRRFSILAVMFGAMILYALGRYTPLFGVIYHTLPGVDLFRRPADSLFLVSALGAFIAGFGINAFLRRQSEPSHTAMLVLYGLIGFSYVAAFSLAIWLDKLSLAWIEIGISIVFLAVSIGALIAAREMAMKQPIATAALLAACLTLDFAWNMRPNDSTGLPPAEYEAMRLDTKDETIDELKRRVVRDETRRDRVEIAGLGFHWPNLGLVHGLESTLGYNPLRLGYFVTATGALDHVSGIDQHRFGPIYPSYRSPFANMLGLRFIAIGAPIETVDPKTRANPFLLVARTDKAFIYENPDALPRVMVVPTAKIQDQDQLLQSGQWPEADLRQVAFVERTSMPLPRARITGTAAIKEYTNTEITVIADAPRGGVLMLHDVWHPWWFAYADGKPTPVLRANGIFRAVILPQGATTVVFRFEPFRGMLRRLFVSIGVLAR